MMIRPYRALIGMTRLVAVGPKSQLTTAASVDMKITFEWAVRRGRVSAAGPLRQVDSQRVFLRIWL